MANKEKDNTGEHFFSHDCEEELEITRKKNEQLQDTVSENWKDIHELRTELSEMKAYKHNLDSKLNETDRRLKVFRPYIANLKSEYES